MNTTVEVIVPGWSKDPLTDGLRWLTGELSRALPDADSSFGLGGENGYGVNFENATFAMRRYYWGDCDCGYDERAEQWFAEHRHSADCYSTEYRALVGENPHRPIIESLIEERNSKRLWSAASEAVQKRITAECDREHKWVEAKAKALCAKHGIEWNGGRGSAVHCTCGHKEEWLAWSVDNNHSETCSLVLPNFHHKPSGFKVRWYKWIGRDNEIEGAMPDLNLMLAECRNSVRKPS